jgi:hypothetical protein
MVLMLDTQAYNAIHPDKHFDFPKAHSHAHLFDDIEEKGVTMNFNTKFSEKMHAILKIFYLRLSNFKDVESQVRFYHLCISHAHAESLSIVFKVPFTCPRCGHHPRGT